MTGKLTGRSSSPQFAFEEKVKTYLAGWGGTEVYTLSLVPKEYVGENVLKLKNPLGVDSEYLRTSLMPSLVSATEENKGTFENFHLFEMSNVYIPKKNDLPEEKLILGGIFEGYSYRDAKGIIEALLSKLNIDAIVSSSEEKGFTAGKCALILAGKEMIGKIGYTEDDENIYYEFEVSKLSKLSKSNNGYKDISKFPAQIEDITFVFPEKTYIGEVVQLISNSKLLISNVELKDVYKDSYTFRIEYQNPNKTLTDKEVEEIRNKILTQVKNKFGGQIKE